MLQFARENPGWGYDRIVAALANLGCHISDQTVGNILKRHGLGPAPERKRNTSWTQFIRRHKEVLWATDFFTTEVWTSTGLTTFYVLFFLHLQTRRVILGGITPFPKEDWLKHVARNLTVDDGPMAKARFLLHDRDAKFSKAFDDVFQSVGIEPLKLPPRSPNLNAFAERWVRSVKDECLDQLILFGERSLHHMLNQYLAHHNASEIIRDLRMSSPSPTSKRVAGKEPFVNPSGLADCLTSTIAPPDRLSPSRLFVRRAVKMMSVRVYHFTPPCPMSLYVRLFTANISLRHTPLGFGSFF